jgi:threonine synthase
MKKAYLKCRTCGLEYDSSEPVFRCKCGEPLDLVWNGAGIDKTQCGQLRYAAFFPFEPTEWVSLGEGSTPLVNVQAFADELHMSEVAVKNESANPTWSFKDRGTASCIAHARALGYQKVGTVSSGNMAASVAAYAAAAGLEAYILVKGNVADEKLAPIAIYGAHLLRVAGPYDELYNESLRLGAERGIYFMNSDVPFRPAGSRSISYEIAEAMNFSVPDWVVVPTSAGGNIRGIINGFEDLQHAGLTKKMPRFLCAQARNNQPIVEAFVNGWDKIRRAPGTETIAHAIDNPFPPSGNRVLAELRRLGGAAVSVPEQDIVRAQADMARRGLFGQPASCVPLAALRLARAAGIVGEGQSAVLVMTGSGLKYTAAFSAHQLHWQDCAISDLPQFLK